MRVLGEARTRHFEDRMADHLRMRFAHAGFDRDDPALRDFILESIRLARTFGLEHEYDLRRFIEFRAEYGRESHLLGWAARILNDPTLSGCGKMEQIDDFTLYVLR